MLKEKKWGKETIRCIVVMMMSFVLLGFTSGTSSAAIRKEVISSTAKLPESMQFNVIAEPFAWGKDVTRVMLNAGEEFNSSDLAVADFNVTGNHYSAQAQKFDFQGPRKVLDVYPVDEEGNKVDSSNYIIIELEYGSDVQGAHTGSYNYANYYTPLTVTYDVKWSVTGDKYTQNEVVNLVCDEFILERHVDSTQEANFNFVDYAFYEPKKDNTKKPLIVFFHGMGEGGAESLDNKGVQMYAYPEVAFAEKEIQDIMGGSAYVLLPQAPSRWPNNGFTNESGYLPVVESLIDTIIAENSDIDTNRIYIGGLSMGGYMACRVILNRPQMYAAAFLCAQAYAITDQDAEVLKDMAIWVSCSEADYTCAMNPYTFASYEKLVAAGGREVKCAVMEDNSSDPTSRFRFYSSDREGYELYNAEQENENTKKGQFVWDNVVYSGHNGGWVPVFANGQYYYDNNNKITIMDWLAAQSRVLELKLDTSKVQTLFSQGEAFQADQLVVTAAMVDGTSSVVTDYTILPVDTSKVGSVVVNVGYSGVFASYTITIVPGGGVIARPTNTPAVSQPTDNPSTESSISLSSTSVVLSKKGVNTYKLIAKVTGSNETVVWSTSNKRIATVNQKGVISAKGAGTATITASINGKAVACKVTVRNASFKVSKTTFTIKKGKTAKIKVTVSPKKKVTYKSSSNKIVKVSKNGVVKGVKKGTAQITVTYQGVKQIVNVKVR